MELWGRVTSIIGNKVTFSAESIEELQNLQYLMDRGYSEAVLQISDERHISAVQRRKSYAMIKDFAEWSGYDREEMKIILKFEFEAETGHEYFSFARTDMTTAREFISFTIGLAMLYEVPLKKSALQIQDDLDVYMYQSLKNRSCVLCGKKADVHHIETVGMGNDRKLVDHRRKHLIALCREHHQDAHQIGWVAFSELHHLKGIILDPKTLNDLGIMTYKRMKEIDDEQSSASRTSS